jgi:hypothetical protein
VASSKSQLLEQGGDMLTQRVKMSEQKDHVELMMRMLIDGANSQHGYENGLEIIEFYDI